MDASPGSLRNHRIQAQDAGSVVHGTVRYAPIKSLWFIGMAAAAVVGGAMTFTWQALAVFLGATASVLLLGHSLGSHRKLIHGSFDCPPWLERFLVWMGVQVGLAGPLGLLQQHELRDYAQRLPDCHPYLRHGAGFWRDAWWQLHCELRLDRPPSLRLEPRIAGNRFYRFLERTWMLQQLPPALMLYALGGWGFVFWGVCARITAGVFGHWLIGYFAHNHGTMHFCVDGAAVQGRNIRWTSLLTMGESWHNNHHAFPGSAKLGLAAGEWDPGWWMLVLLHKARLVWNIRLPSHLPEREELRALHPVTMEHAEGRLQGMAWLWRSAGQREGRVLHLESAQVHLAAGRLERIAGVPVQPNPAARRLAAVLDGQVVQGLPGLWLAIANRSAGHRLLLAAFLPMTILAEKARRFFTLVEGTPRQAA